MSRLCLLAVWLWLLSSNLLLYNNSSTYLTTIILLLSHMVLKMNGNTGSISKAISLMWLVDDCACQLEPHLVLPAVNTYMYPLCCCLGFLSPWYSVPKASIPRQPGRSYVDFYDLTLEVTFSLGSLDSGGTYLEPHSSVWEEGQFPIVWRCVRRETLL